MDDFLPQHPVKTRKPRARTQDLVSFSLNDVTADSEFRRSAMTPLAPRASGGARSVYTGGGAALWELPRFPSPSPAEPETRLLRTLNISTMRVCVKEAGEERTAKVSLFLKSSKVERILHQL